jgi:hypothetical protein
VQVGDVGRRGRPVALVQQVAQGPLAAGFDGEDPIDELVRLSIGLLSLCVTAGEGLLQRADVPPAATFR